VRLLLRLPGPLRAAMVHRAAAGASTVRFVASALRDALLQSLPVDLAARLERMATVEPAPIEVPSRGALEDPRSALGLADGAPYAAWVGRLVPDKRPALAIAAARVACLPLVMAGDGPELAQLQRDARRGGAASGVVFAGRLGRDQALSIVANARVLLHTSCAEGAPTVVREARALDVPVVACDAGDLASWAASDPGIVLARADVASLASALARVVDAPREVA
jgi:teichuronic acid biosynthesis glycosyltransferase TuaC